MLLKSTSVFIVVIPYIKMGVKSYPMLHRKQNRSNSSFHRDNPTPSRWVGVGSQQCVSVSAINIILSPARTCMIRGLFISSIKSSWLMLTSFLHLTSYLCSLTFKSNFMKLKEASYHHGASYEAKRVHTTQT